MTKQEVKDKAVAFAKLVNSQLEIIDKAQEQFDADIDLDVDENLEHLEELVESDEDLKALHVRYTELLNKIDL